LDQFNKYLNKHLQATAKELNINKPITTYYARHSWATIAAGNGASRDVISHALGHGNNTVTDTYIDFDMSNVDQVNQAVLKVLLS
jgi:integrase